MTQSIKMLPPPSYLVRRTPANIVKAYEKDLSEKDLSLRESQAKSGKSKSREQKDAPFTAKVRRKWSNTKAKVGRRLGLYTFLEPLPLGLYIDMVI